MSLYKIFLIIIYTIFKLFKLKMSKTFTYFKNRKLVSFNLSTISFETYSKIKY